MKLNVTRHRLGVCVGLVNVNEPEQAKRDWAMPELKVIARYTDGRMVKGLTSNFWPTKQVFHISPEGAGPQAPTKEVRIDELKAVFVVHDLAGRPDYQERKGFDANSRISGQKLQVRFKDGEQMFGSSMTYDPTAPGFYLFPADPKSNNDRVFVVNAAVAQVDRL